MGMNRKMLLSTLRDLRARRHIVKSQIAEVVELLGHLGDHDLERYHLGMVRDEAELVALEEHLIGCAVCTRRAEGAANYVDAMRRAIAFERSVRRGTGGSAECCRFHLIFGTCRRLFFGS
jgi:hypothetical protein